MQRSGSVGLQAAASASAAGQLPRASERESLPQDKGALEALRAVGKLKTSGACAKSASLSGLLVGGDISRSLIPLPAS